MVYNLVGFNWNQVGLGLSENDVDTTKLSDFQKNYESHICTYLIIFRRVEVEGVSNSGYKSSFCEPSPIFP
jgi:hypothetical protein